MLYISMHTICFKLSTKMKLLEDERNSLQFALASEMELRMKDEGDFFMFSLK